MNGRRALGFWAAASGLAMALLTVERALLDTLYRPE